MKKIAPIVASVGLMAGCGAGEADLPATLTTKAEVTARAASDFKEATTPEDKYYLQFLDDETYRVDLERTNDRWKMGDDCLRETPFTTRDNLRDPGIAAAAILRGDGLLEIEPVGLESRLVFEIEEYKLSPGGTIDERAETVGILAAYGCLYGPRNVYGDNIPVEGTDIDSLTYSAE